MWHSYDAVRHKLPSFVNERLVLYVAPRFPPPAAKVPMPFGIKVLAAQFVNTGSPSFGVMGLEAGCR
jgi:hypothetical protein